MSDVILNLRSEDKTTIEQALIGAAGILDVVKTEWEPEGYWSEWDDSVRQGITRALKILSALSPADQPNRQ